MDINRLNEFITLASLLNYSKAANQLYLTQPALSRHIHDLEATLGAPLFIRDTHSVHLTSIGELFFEEAKAIVDRYEHALLLVKEASSNTSGELKLGFLGTVCQGFLSEFVSAFISSHPDICLSLNCGNLDTLTSQLTNGESDIAVLTFINKDFQSGFESLEINRFRIYIVVHPNHLFSSREEISLSELSGFPAINFSAQTNPIASDFNRQIFKKANSKYNMTTEISSVEEGIFLASINQGFFILPEYLLSNVPDTLNAIPISDDNAYITLNLIWKRMNDNPAISPFVNEFRTYMKNHYDKESNRSSK